MEFKYTVENTAAITDEPLGIVFQPTDLTITVENKETIMNADGTTTEVLNVRTVLIETLPTGYIKEEKMHKFPITVLQAIIGFDPQTMGLIVNPAALNQILAGFNLKLAGT